jgi:hypothetical protein
MRREKRKIRRKSLVFFKETWRPYEEEPPKQPTKEEVLILKIEEILENRLEYARMTDEEQRRQMGVAEWTRRNRAKNKRIFPYKCRKISMAPDLLISPVILSPFTMKTLR